MTVQSEYKPMHVVVDDFNMPFGSMVGFLVKLALASIPALIILMLILVGIPTLLLVVFRISMFGFN